jgi:hypothetical protein
MSHVRSFSPKPPTFVLVVLLAAGISMLFPFNHAALAHEAADAGPGNSPASPADAAWQVENLFPVWYDTSLALDSQGWPHVGYVKPGDASNGYNSSVWYAYQDAGGWHHQIVSIYASNVVMKLDAADRPHIAYRGYHSYAMCYGICYARLDGATWQHSSVDWFGDLIFDLVLDSNGRPRISYYDSKADGYWIMYAQQLADSSWQTERVVDAGQGTIVSISDAPLALDSNDRPYIAYYAYQHQPTLASRNSGTWQTEVIEPSYSITQFYIGLAIDAGDRPHVGYTYWTNEVRYAYRVDGVWQSQSVEAGGFWTGTGLSLALDAAGRPHLSHCRQLAIDGPWELHYNYYDGVTWLQEIANSGVKCDQTAIAIDTAGRAHIAFSGNMDPLLRIATRQTGDLVRVDPANGGVFTYTDIQGNATIVQAPSGAVTAPTDLLYTPVATAAPPSGFAFAGHAFNLDAYRDGTLLAGFVFEQPINITIHYSPADVAVVDPTALVLMVWNGNAWVDAATTCAPPSVYNRHPDENWLSVPVCHLSRFALFGPTHSIYLPLVFRETEASTR